MALTQDMDMAILARSLKLLHSPEEDSAEQLRIILEDTIKCKYGNRKPINLSVLGLNKKTVTVDEVRGKRIKLEEGSGVSPIYREDLEESQTSGSDSDDGVALEILDDDLSCVVCHEMAVGANNNLVECVECHSLYHQECHKPAITQDVNDPRFVWYCATCTKTMNKVASSSKGSPSSVSQSGKPPKASSKSSSSSSSSSKSFNAFASSSSGKSSSGSYSSKSGSSSSHQSSSKSSTKVTIPVPKINTITADKRLQIMKKNAAKKQEKRKLPK